MSMLQTHLLCVAGLPMQLQPPPGAGGPCECRVLLPGLDLADHGLECLQEELAGPGG